MSRIDKENLNSLNPIKITRIIIEKRKKKLPKMEMVSLSLLLFHYPDSTVSRMVYNFIGDTAKQEFLTA